MGKQETDSNAKSSEQFSWSSKGEEVGSPDSISAGIHKAETTRDGAENQLLGDPRTDNTTTDELASESSSRGRVDKRNLLEYIKKFSSRLELIDAQLASLGEAYDNYTKSHLDRLIQRQIDNEKFTCEVNELRKNIFENKNVLKQELSEITRVLGVSEIQ